MQTFAAIDSKGRISKHGQAISRLGVNPRLGHLLLIAQELEKEQQIAGLVELACLLVALLESNEKGSDDIESCLLNPSFVVKQQQTLLLKKCRFTRMLSIHCSIEKPYFHFSQRIIDLTSLFL